MKLEVKIKSIGQLESGMKKDGTGKWFARDLVLVANDGSMYPDEFAVRITGNLAENCSLREGQPFEADISFSIREYNGRKFQDLYLRDLRSLSNIPQGEDPNANKLF